jgi:hypothetical protein
MNALPRGILKSVALVALLIIARLPLLCPNVYGKEVKRETSLSNFLGAGRFHILGADGG